MVLAVLFFAIAGTALYLRSDRGQDQILGQIFLLPQKGSKTSFLLPQQDMRLLQDSDKDGLQDWEETIYGTGPENPDTDGDGTQDGEEIRAQRNPLKPGPDDLAEQAEPSQNGNVEKGGFSEINLTKDLGEAFIQQYLYAKNSNQSINPTAFSQNLVKSYLENRAAKIEAPKIGPDEIKIVKDSSPEAIKTYLNALADIAKRDLSDLPDPLFLFANILKTTDISLLNDPALSAELEKFDEIVLRYEKMAEDMKRLPVPSGLANYHRQAIENLLKFKLVVLAFRGADQDIVRAALASEDYADAGLAIQKIAQDIKTELNQRKISFGKTDSAKVVFGF